ncbi:MAG: hypothetical protein WAX07_08725 [Candidatus Altiarchaeia archaeon]
MKEGCMESRRSTERIITLISSMRPGGLIRKNRQIKGLSRPEKLEKESFGAGLV